MKQIRFSENSPHKDQPIPMDHVQDLLTYHERSDLEKAVRMQVASQLSATKLPKLNQIFKKVLTT